MPTCNFFVSKKQTLLLLCMIPTWLLWTFFIFFLVLLLVTFGLSIYGAVRPSSSTTVDNIIVSAAAMGEFVYAKTHHACVSVYNVTTGSQVRTGSGFIWEVNSSAQLVVVTAAHVIQESSQVEIVINGAEGENLQIACDVVGMDLAADIGVLVTKANQHSFNPTTQATAQWTDDDTDLTGSFLFSIGNPLGEDFNSISSGVIRDNKYVPTTDSGSIESIYTSVSITNGNSGGPLFNVAGRVCGLSNWVAVGNENQALNSFSGGVNAYMASRIVPRILNNTNTKGYLGLSDIDIGAGAILLELKSTYPAFVASGFDLPQGVVVLGLDMDNINIANSRCGSAGIQANDILLSINNVGLGVFENQFSPTRVSWFTNPGTTVTVIAVRPSTGQLLTFQVILDTFPAARDFPLTTYC